MNSFFFFDMSKLGSFHVTKLSGKTTLQEDLHPRLERGRKCKQKPKAISFTCLPNLIPNSEQKNLNKNVSMYLDVEVYEKLSAFYIEIPNKLLR